MKSSSIGWAAALFAAHGLGAQTADAVRLRELVDGLAVTPRVLVIGMHPDDEPSELLAWASRGRHLETAYLSVTRGEAGESFGGDETGALLGAVRTEEALAARRIDGAKLFYTRAYDFGFARNTADVLEHWNRDSVVGDLVAIIRSFRPHVIVAMLTDSTYDGDGQHQALSLFVDHAFTSAADPARFPPSRFGMPWAPAKLLRPGAGFSIETAEFDRMLGKTYAQLGDEVRAMQRSQGLLDLTTPHKTAVELRRIGSRAGDSAAVDQSLFGGIDTSFSRLSLDAPPKIANVLRRLAAYADSARSALDLTHPSVVVPYLAQVAYLANVARSSSKWCQHPSATATVSGPADGPCDQHGLDLDAAVDLVRERSTAALLIAAGIAFEATADRELLASGDTAVYTVTMFNHGTEPATLVDARVSGSLRGSLEPIVVRPDSSVQVVGTVAGIGDGRAWWVGPRGGTNRGGDRFEDVLSTADGLAHGGLILASMHAYSVTVPETIRRATDATVTVSVSGVAVTMSLGPVTFRHADAPSGLQKRLLGGIPGVTLQFARGLEWIPRNKTLMRDARVAVKSHSDSRREFGLEIVTPKGMPKGMRMDSLPKTMRLVPHEERELFIHLRGKVTETDRLPLGLTGLPMEVVVHDTPRRPTTHAPIPMGKSRVYETGLRVAQRGYLPPVRLFPSSGEWLQPIDIEVPPTLTVLYVPGVSDDITTALKQVGVWVNEASTADQLLSVDLSRVTTIAIGPGALEAHPELIGQSGRLTDFVRKGGTLVVLRGGRSTVSSGLLPFPMALARPIPERVTQADAPVTVLDRGARVLTWPNKLGGADWDEWLGARALDVPTTVDPRYTKVLEIHDREEKENRNSILIARVGKGTIVYTTLTLDMQIAGGVPGALRLFVNLLSAGLPAR